MSLFYMSFKFNITEPKGSIHHADNYSGQIQLKSKKINNEQIKYKTAKVHGQSYILRIN